jgi:hypothetical protein
VYQKSIRKNVKDEKYKLMPKPTEKIPDKEIPIIWNEGIVL